MELVQNFSALCRANGWKRTPQRMAVFRCMDQNRQHPSVDQVWQQVRCEIPSISRESVYRILNEFAQAGVICRLDQFEQARYDAETGNHGHFICTVCKAITDFPLMEPVKVPPEIEPGGVCHIELRLAGICPDCRENGKTKE